MIVFTYLMTSVLFEAPLLFSPLDRCTKFFVIIKKAQIIKGYVAVVFRTGDSDEGCPPIYLHLIFDISPIFQWLFDGLTTFP